MEIQKGVPIPRTGGVNGGSKYPWREMESGDSVVLPLGDMHHSAAARKYYNAARQFLVNNEKEDWKPVTRVEHDGEEIVGIRVWLVAPDEA